MGDDASQRSLNREDPQLRAIVAEVVAELAARVAAIEELRDRVERRDRIEEILDSAGQPPGPRHAAPKRDRHGMFAIKGGLAAMAPAAALLLHGAPGPVAAAACRWVWRAQRDHVRWAVAALFLALAGVAFPATAAEGPASHPAPALSCRAPRPYHPDRRDGDGDGKTVVARLPLGCPAAGEGAAATGGAAGAGRMVRWGHGQAPAR